MRKDKKRPVLTSPWKIGTFVALMLLVTGFGTGFYLVRTYDLELRWLGADASRWIVDSYSFFKEVYPLAAGVIVLSLITYFLIASAVRRYKYYLDSGQDYRKMVQLAGSIDDLTNPAQIAKLSDYPDLQDILRSYGDQIREISEQLESKEEEVRSIDLEVEIDSVLAGNEVQEDRIEGKWWAPVIRKIESHVKGGGAPSAEDGEALSMARQVMSSAALSFGRMLETVAQAGQEAVEIAAAAGEYGGESPGAAGPAQAGAGAAPLASIEAAAADLSRNGQAMREISEENNGLALNLALMAARGEIGEKELAGIAEKMRSSAERFGKIGRELETIAGSVSESCSVARGMGAGSDAGVGSTACAEYAGRLEEKCRSLQDSIASLGGDIDEVYRSIKDSLQKLGSGGEEGSGNGGTSLEDDDSLVNFGREGKSRGDENDESLVIDHGKLWEEQGGEEPGSFGTGAIVEDDQGLGENAEPEAAGRAEPERKESPAFAPEDASVGAEDEEEEKVFDIPSEAEVAEDAQMEDISQPDGMSGQPAGMSERAAGTPAEPAGQADQPGAGGEWMDMPGHRWVDTEAGGRSAGTSEPSAEDGSVALERQEQAGTAGEQEAPAPEHGERAGATAGMETVQGALESADANTSDDEPVYDLFELGAVVYTEEMENSSVR